MFPVGSGVLAVLVLIIVVICVSATRWCGYTARELVTLLEAITALVGAGTAFIGQHRAVGD